MCDIGLIPILRDSRFRQKSHSRGVLYSSFFPKHVARSTACVSVCWLHGLAMQTWLNQSRCSLRWYSCVHLKNHLLGGIHGQFVASLLGAGNMEAVVNIEELLELNSNKLLGLNCWNML